MMKKNRKIFNEISSNQNEFSIEELNRKFIDGCLNH